MPSPRDKPVRIGDIGYIFKGRFQHLFNATDHLQDGIVLGRDVPEDFVPLELGDWDPDPSYREPGALPSAHIQTTSVEAALACQTPV